jgi:ATP-binding cassette, subfamily B, bacterial
MQNMASSLRLFGRTLGLIWAANPFYAVGLALATIATGLVPVVRLWVAKLIIDRLVAGVASGQTEMGPLVTLVVLELLLTTVGTVLGTISESASAALGHVLRVRIGESIMRVAMRLEFSALEDPSFHDRLRRAQVETSYRPINLIIQLRYATSGLVGLLGTLGLLAAVNPLAPLTLVALGVPYVYVQVRGGQLAYNTILHQSPDAGRLGYLGMMTGQPDVAKEVRLFGLAEYLLGAYREVGQRLLHTSLRVVRFQMLGGLLSTILATGGYFGAYLYFIAQTLAGRLSIGDLTVYTGAFWQGSMQAQDIAQGVGSMLENGLFLRDLFEFLALDHEPTSAPIAARSALTHATSGITFDKVHFRYPGMPRDAVDGVTLHVPPGSVAALVGENGAGKTTLIKLLCGLYEPSGGHILLDGHDIREVEQVELRAQFGVLFQDFVHYHLSARENIGFGDARYIDDDDRIRAVAERACVADTLAALPNGYETMLSRQFEDGHELSGGEWQRLALARAYLRDAPILILDEPTANLDPRAERRIFDEVRRLLVGRTAIIISHRFSSVRLADQIFVLHEGKLVEQGSHDHLVAIGGRYAELYELQAAAYR